MKRTRRGRRTVAPAFAVAFAASLAACETGGLDRPGNEGNPAAGLEVDPVPAFSAESPGNGEPFHQVVSVVALESGDFVVADQSSRLVVLGPGGELVRSFGGSGDGPGEFRRLGWVQRMPGDSIVAWDAGLRRATVFSADGDVGRTITPGTGAADGPPPMLLGVFADGDLLAARQGTAPPPEGGEGIVRPELRLARHDAEGLERHALATVPGDERAIASGVLLGGVPFLRTTTFAVDGSEFLVATGDRFIVQAYDRSEALVRSYGDDSEAPALTEALRASIEVPEPLVPFLPATLPAVTGVIVDGEGRIWVGTPAGGGEGGSTWRVFHRDGEKRGVVAMPPGFRPLDVAEGGVVGVWTDELGVEHVRLHPLLRPEG